MCRPAKLTEGTPHPDVIMESALLAAVAPPNITYEHHLQVTRCHSSPSTLATASHAPSLQAYSCPAHNCLLK